MQRHPTILFSYSDVTFGRKIVTLGFSAVEEQFKVPVCGQFLQTGQLVAYESPDVATRSSRRHQMGGDWHVVVPPDVYGGAYGPIVRPVASAATAAPKVAGGVRCAH